MYHVPSVNPPNGGIYIPQKRFNANAFYSVFIKNKSIRDKRRGKTENRVQNHKLIMHLFVEFKYLRKIGYKTIEWVFIISIVGCKTCSSAHNKPITNLRYVM